MRALKVWTLIAVAAVVGCRSSSSEEPPAEREVDHAHMAPHGGALIELGDELAHLEIVLDPATGTLTGYTLDGEAEQPVRVAQPTIALAVTLPGQPALDVTLAAVPSSLTGETVGDTSQFRAVAPALVGARQFDGVVTTLAVRGQEFTHVVFRFPSEAHD